MTTKLAEGVWQLDLTGVNAYVVDDGGAITLVDAGMPWQAGRIERALEGLGGGADGVERVLVTHYDLDHAGGFGRIDGLDAPVFAGEPDAGYLAGTDSPPPTDRKGLFQRAMGLTLRPPAGPVSTVADGESIGGFTAYHTPGHTPGHIVYIHEERSVALLGDLVRSTGEGFTPAPWIMSQDTAAIRRSVRDLVDRAPAFEVGGPGHGSPIATAAFERLRDCADGFD